MHVAQKHALGPDPRLRSGFAITTCIKKQELEARRMNPFSRDALQPILEVDLWPCLALSLLAFAVDQFAKQIGMEWSTACAGAFRSVTGATGYGR
jgi:hypothetical protein